MQNKKSYFSTRRVAVIALIAILVMFIGFTYCMGAINGNNNVVETAEAVEHIHRYTDENDVVCNDCGFVRYYEGDYNNDGELGYDDAEYMLYNIFYGDTLYPLDENQPLRDYTSDGMINSDDAIWLHDYVARFKSHTLVYHKAVASTCASNGNKEYWFCTHCSKYFSDPVCQTEIELTSTVLPMYGHSFEEIERVNSTCTENGKIVYECTICYAKKTIIIIANGHQYGYDNVCDICGNVNPIHEHQYVPVVTVPGCITMGYTTYTCSLCQDKYISDYIDPNGHTWDNGTIVTAKTCSTNGIKEYQCTCCDAKRQDIIYAGHEWNTTLVTEKTCTTDGEVRKECSLCHTVISDITPAGHTWNAGVVTTPASCTESGIKTVTCTRCDATGTEVIPKTGHRYVNGECTVCHEKYIDNVTPSDHPIHGMFFLIPDVVSNYGPEIINEYGVLLYVNEGAVLDKVAVYLTQDATMWRRCIACTGTNIEFAVYVPYLSYGTDIYYTGLNSDWINTFALREGADGIWRYSEYATIGANLADNRGNLLLSLYDIGQAGAETRIFDDLNKMKLWLSGEDPDAPHIHTEVIDPMIPETCTENGLTAGSHCSVCGEVIVARTIIPKSHAIIGHVDAVAATCNASGHSAYDVCSRCGKVGYVYYPQLSHNMKTEVVQELSCTTNGIIRHYCTNQGCDYSYNVETVGEHNYQVSGRKTPTCEVSGYVEYKCTKCYDTYRDTIPGQHNYVGAVTKRATRSEKGIMTYTCSVCRDSYSIDIEQLGEGEYVLLIQDDSPWYTDTNTVLLNQLVSNGYIAGWDMATSTELKGSLNLNNYGVIFIANDQTTTTYNNLASCTTKLLDFVEDGGSLVYGACDNGWHAGAISKLDGTVVKKNYYSYYNYIVDRTHPIVTGQLTDYVELTDSMLYHNYTSHTYFTNLPEDAVVILQDGNGNPTLVEYNLGENGGTIILSGLTWEHNYVHRYQSLSYAKSVYDDLIVYAMSRQDVCLHEYGEGEVIAPTCLERGYTRHICSLCEREYRDNFVDKIPHTITHFSRVEATREREGNIEYWHCSACGKYFKDSAYSIEITREETVIPIIHTGTITWKNDDGTVLKTEELEIGTTPRYTGSTPTKASTVQYIYTFDGWTPTIVAVDGDKVYTAQYKSTTRTYHIVWKNYDNTTLGSEYVTYNATPSYHWSTPTKPSTSQYNYTFSGWSPIVEKATSDKTYTAQFSSTLRSYTITWVNNGSTIKTQTYTYGSTPSYSGSTPTKSKDAEYTYTFSGWNPSIQSVTGDKTYTAQYSTTKNKYKFTIGSDAGFSSVSAKYSNGNTISSGTYIEWGTTIYLSSALKTDYEFKKWYRNGSSISTNSTYSFNMTTYDVEIYAESHYIPVPIPVNTDITIKLEWGSYPNDLDSHLVYYNSNGNSQYHVYYGHMSDTNSSLDRDDTSAYGPEIITIRNNISSGKYVYYVYNFSHGNASDLSNSGAKITLTYDNGNKVQTFSVPSGSGYYWNVFTIDIASGTITTVNTITSSSPTGY